mgnify:CR=1 FL=1|tara:strand:+ start:1272 stop:2345 length:1074 start_codon:yes stop_codon:yes gene_type:complete
MRLHQNRHEVHNLYVLGAGASRAISTGNKDKKLAPLDKEFCSEIKKIIAPRWAEEAARRVEADFIHHSVFAKTGLEEMVCQQLSDLSFIDSIWRRAKNGKRRPDQFLEDVVHVIAHRLKSCKAKKEEDLSLFLGKTFKGDQEKNNKNRIITFNYDTIIDDILLQRFSPQQLYFDNIVQPEGQSEGEKYPILIKLHGSINWRCQKSEYSKIFDTPKRLKKSPTKTYNTKNCHHIEDIRFDNSICKASADQLPLIIPPIPQKPITSVSIFRYLWSYAFEYLTEAQNIILVGYSLPPTDRLAVSLFSNFKNKKLNNLTIIDPNEKVLGRWIKLFKRVGVREHDVHYFQDFNEYISRNLKG